MIHIKNLMMGGFAYVKNYGLRFFNTFDNIPLGNNDPMLLQRKKIAENCNEKLKAHGGKIHEENIKIIISDDEDGNVLFSNGICRRNR